ncbi:MAG: hypothetical protein CMQ45_10915 [Gammaproteobacteria bacterium]|nr:hypothetical protein [Gammaproteobacteria bacterium]
MATVRQLVARPLTMLILSSVIAGFISNIEFVGAQANFIRPDPFDFSILLSLIVFYRFCSLSYCE